jgi:tetratricopeptide (TPR) repeat protein
VDPESEYLADMTLCEVIMKRSLEPGQDHLRREARQHADRACRKAKDDPLPHLVRGRLLSRMNDNDNARADFELVLRLAEDRASTKSIRARALTMKAALLVAGRDYVAARADLERALDLDNSLAEAYFQRALIHLKDRQRQQPRSAVNDLSEAITRKPDLADAYFYRGAAYHDLGEFEDAIRDLDRAASLRTDSNGFFYMSDLEFVRAECAYRLENWRVALESYARYQEGAGIGHKGYQRATERINECKGRLTEAGVDAERVEREARAEVAETSD